MKLKIFPYMLFSLAVFALESTAQAQCPCGPGTDNPNYYGAPGDYPGNPYAPNGAPGWPGDEPGNPYYPNGGPGGDGAPPDGFGGSGGNGTGEDGMGGAGGSGCGDDSPVEGGSHCPGGEDDESDFGKGGYGGGPFDLGPGGNGRLDIDDEPQGNGGYGGSEESATFMRTRWILPRQLVKD